MTYAGNATDRMTYAPAEREPAPCSGVRASQVAYTIEMGRIRFSPLDVIRCRLC